MPQSSSLPISHAGSDPWEDQKWTQVKWTIYRGVAYDLTSFIDRHPAGNWLIQLAIGRDCTALFESYHLRPEVAVAHLKRLPVLEGFPVEAVPQAPYPNDSELYNTIRCMHACRQLACAASHCLPQFSFCLADQKASCDPSDVRWQRELSSCPMTCMHP